MASEGYGVGQACLNGHPIASDLVRMPQFGADHCPDCGAASLTACPACSTPIRGSYWPVLSIQEWQPSAFCHACGKPYPWTTAGVAAGRELVGLLDGLTDVEREALSAGFDDLVRDTPRTGVAAMRVKLALGKVGREGASALREILVSIATDAAKESMGL